MASQLNVIYNNLITAAISHGIFFFQKFPVVLCLNLLTARCNWTIQCYFCISLPDLQLHLHSMLTSSFNIVRLWDDIIDAMFNA